MRSARELQTEVCQADGRVGMPFDLSSTSTLVILGLGTIGVLGMLSMLGSVAGHARKVHELKVECTKLRSAYFKRLQTLQGLASVNEELAQHSAPSKSK
ncbi:MAG: hypothetical protein AAGB51_11440 [Planctomycetota bacterium]